MGTLRRCCHQKLCHISLDWHHLWRIHRLYRNFYNIKVSPTINIIGIFWRNEEFLIKHTGYTGSLRDSHEEWMGWELEAKQWWSMGWMRVFYDWRQISFALKTFADFSNASVTSQCIVRKTADALLTQSTTWTPIFVKKYQLFTFPINIKHLISN